MVDILNTFVAIILLPIIEMMPYVSHRHLEIGDPVYRYAGRFNPSEFFLFVPYLLIACIYVVVYDVCEFG